MLLAVPGIIHISYKLFKVQYFTKKKKNEAKIKLSFCFCPQSCPINLLVTHQIYLVALWVPWNEKQRTKLPNDKNDAYTLMHQYKQHVIINTGLVFAVFIYIFLSTFRWLYFYPLDQQTQNSCIGMIKCKENGGFLSLCVSLSRKVSI